MTDERAWCVRPLQPADVPQVRRIQGLSPQAAQFDVHPQDNCSEHSAALVAESAGAIAGFLLGRRVAPDEMEILNLAVEPLLRRRGVATELLASALRGWMGGIRRVFIEVRATNAAGIAFYAKHGFARTGVREAYYANPVEDAVLMTLERPVSFR